MTFLQHCSLNYVGFFLEFSRNSTINTRNLVKLYGGFTINFSSISENNSTFSQVFQKITQHFETIEMDF